MKTALTPTFREERERFALHHTCEECVYFDAMAVRCSHGYPSEMHRRAAFAPGVGHAMFCKEFELV